MGEEQTSTLNPGEKPREILLVPHTGREENIAAAARTAEVLGGAGIVVRVLAHHDTRALDKHPSLRNLPRVTHGPGAAAGCELVLVLGGDGTFLRAADLARAQDLPVLGINLGHVGFLAEWEVESLDLAIQRVIDKTYRVEDRMTLDVTVYDSDDEVIGRNWALNEVSIENLNRRGVLDAILEVDFRPVSSFGCDGVLISTPTGSTAYAFSAGGPVVWPEVAALLVVPISAHALFSRPLVTAPTSTVVIAVDPYAPMAVLTCDGRRTFDLPPSARVTVRRGTRPVRVVRLDPRSFTERLVAKFGLPVEGWRHNSG